MNRLSFLAFLLSAGCSNLHGVRVDAIGVAAQKPSQVAAYVRVSDEGKALAELDARSFVVYEDDQKLEAARIGATLLDPALVASHQTLLLVDNSAATEKDVRKELARAIAIFVERVRSVEPVSVYAFDGGPEIRLIAEYSRATAAPPPDTARLEALVPSDSSRNLHGAVQKALARLDALLVARPRPLKVGTLVVFSGGPDLAGRVDVPTLESAVKEREHALLTIGIGADSAVRELGRDGYVDAHSADTLSLAFEDAAHRVHDRHEQHYLFAYCSPARAGKRRLRLEVRVAAREGAARSGETSAEFDATGFGAGCDPRATPRFESRPQQGP